MNTTEAASVSQLLDQPLTNGNGNVHTLKAREDSLFQSAYQAGLAAGLEAGYRRGYREGFSDGRKLDNVAHGATTAQSLATGLAKRNSATRETRLRGLPCANCGCASYSDEAQCPGCGTSKDGAQGGPSKAVIPEKSQPNKIRIRRWRNRSLAVSPPQA